MREMFFGWTLSVTCENIIIKIADFQQIDSSIANFGFQYISEKSIWKFEIK